MKLNFSNLDKTCQILIILVKIGSNLSNFVKTFFCHFVYSLVVIILSTCINHILIKLDWICQTWQILSNLIKFVKICQIWSKLAKTCQSLIKLVNINQNLSKLIKTSLNLPKLVRLVKSWWNLSKLVKTSQNLPKLAKLLKLR